MTQQTMTRPAAAAWGIPADCIALAEIQYLLDTERIDHIVLAGTLMVSFDGIRDYLRRHAWTPETATRIGTMNGKV